MSPHSTSQTSLQCTSPSTGRVRFPCSPAWPPHAARPRHLRPPLSHRHGPRPRWSGTHLGCGLLLVHLGGDSATPPPTRVRMSIGSQRRLLRTRGSSEA